MCVYDEKLVKNMRFWFDKYIKLMLVKKMFQENGIWSWFFQYLPVALNNGTLAFTSNYEWIEDFSSECKKNLMLDEINLIQF